MIPVIGVTSNVSPAGDKRRQITPKIELEYIQKYYFDFVRAGGGAPVLLTVASEEENIEIVKRIDGVLITGGVDLDPLLYGQENTKSEGINLARDNSEISLINAAREQGKPVFGICRGLQALNTALGGTLIQHIPDTIDDPLKHTRKAEEPEIYHLVNLIGNSPLNEIFGGSEGKINSSHHQSVDTPGDGLEIIGKAPDGAVEAIHCPEDYCTLAVQWHPERMLDDEVMVGLAKWFVKMVIDNK